MVRNWSQGQPSARPLEGALSQPCIVYLPSCCLVSFSRQQSDVKVCSLSLPVGADRSNGLVRTCDGGRFLHVALLQLRVQLKHEHDHSELYVQQTNSIQVCVINKVRSSDSDFYG